MPTSSLINSAAFLYGSSGSGPSAVIKERSVSTANCKLKIYTCHMMSLLMIRILSGRIGCKLWGIAQTLLNAPKSCF